ncbi:hypothetical protein AB0F30_16830 [Streptomyces sp. NPDC029006]|uniref:hypothetical protein n=1 Tax=Streptomyces sp. NPDC029006 TaxID=3155467 RepID=UPI0033C60F09
MFAALWMCDPRYSTNARTLYSILVTYADTQGRGTAKGKPYRRELAAQMGVSVSTVDRTLVEMEVAGMVTIEERPDPTNPANNESNVYHLHDAPLMWQGNGVWTDPLPPGVKAADVAKQLIEQRRAEKREAGVERRGGVPKGVSTKAVKAAREVPGEDESPEGGSSTGAARGSSTDAARGAARTLPNIQSPHQTPSPEPSSTDGRRPSAGSRGSRSGGSAASGKTKPPSLTREQRQQVDAFLQALPKPLADLVPTHVPGNVKAAVLEALAADRPEERSAQQLVEFRMLPKWDKHYASKDAAGPIRKPVGVFIELLKWDRECDDPRCDERTNVDFGEACRACERQAEDSRPGQTGDRPQEQPRADVPKQRSAPRKARCPECHRPLRNSAEDALCSDCRHDHAI